MPPSQSDRDSNDAPWWASGSVLVAGALMMAATLPGRSVGLGLITTRVLDSFEGLTDANYGAITMVATLVGSLLCFPGGWLMDRLPSRWVVLGVFLGLAGAVLGMALASNIWVLALMLTLTRGLGQSMLSVVSIATMGKWFRRDGSLAMGAYAILLTILMAALLVATQMSLARVGWQAAWIELALILAAVGATAWALLVVAGEPHGDRAGSGEEPEPREEPESDVPSATLGQALRSPCYWVFAVSMFVFALTSSGIALYLQPILEDRGLAERVFQICQVIGLVTGLLGNLIGGWIGRQWSLAWVLAAAMFLLAVSLAALPALQTAWQAYLQAGVAGFAGGLVTVLFFSVWPHAFGPANLGRIQGGAQMLTVLASAAGPWVIPSFRHIGDGYPLFVSLAVVSAGMAVAAAVTTVPSAAAGYWLDESTAEPPSAERLA